MNIEEMNSRKKELGYSYGMIAEYSGLPVSTVQKVLGGITKHPRRKTILALERVFQSSGEKLTGAAVFHPHEAGRNALERNFSLQEESLSYQYDSGKTQGGCTLEDYYALPDDKRAELIDGVIYDMTAPSSIHQMIVLALANQFIDRIRGNQADCIPLVAPVDVLLNDDESTLVQPDFILLCDREKLAKDRINGAPDFLAEVLSPFTRRKDLYLKLYKYENAGVREYWIVDPEQKRVIAYRFSQETDVMVYSFRDRIPVGISGGRAEIDFSVIDDYIRPFMNLE